MILYTRANDVGVVFSVATLRIHSTLLDFGRIIMRKFFSLACIGVLLVIVPAPCRAESPPHDGKNLTSPLLTVPLKIIDDTPYLQVRVNDGPPQWFNLDS